MAFDGIVVANLVHELRGQLLNGRIARIAQPEADELLLTFKTPEGQKRLLISANASLPLIYLTDTNKPSPLTAPNFCTDRGNLPAKAGADHPLYDRTSGRTGRSVPEDTDRGNYGKAQQYHLLRGRRKDHRQH